MSRKHVLIKPVLIALLVGLSAISVALATGSYDIPSFVISGGGGRAESGAYVLNSTIGEPIVGRASGDTYELCTGFGGIWCSDALHYTLYLPIVFKNAP